MYAGENITSKVKNEGNIRDINHRRMSVLVKANRDIICNVKNNNEFYRELDSVILINCQFLNVLRMPQYIYVYMDKLQRAYGMIIQILLYLYIETLSQSNCTALRESICLPLELCKGIWKRWKFPEVTWDQIILRVLVDEEVYQDGLHWYWSFEFLSAWSSTGIIAQCNHVCSGVIN